MTRPRPRSYQRKYRQLPTHFFRKDHPWPLIINYLLSRGYPKARLALFLSTTRERLYSILSSRLSPTWAEGELLFALYTYEKTLEGTQP